MFDLHYFDVTRTHGYVGAYFWFYLFATVLLSYAALWDKRQKRVPNWIWIVGCIPIPAALAIRDLTFDAIFIPALLIICFALRLKMVWGMGDAKAIVWLALLLGSLPAITITMIAILLTSIMRKRQEKAFPFVVPLGIGCIIGLVFILVWLL